MRAFGLSVALSVVFCGVSFAEDGDMSLVADEAKVRERHSAYFEALGSGDMGALAENFTFPAAFKGFLEDVVIATDKDSLAVTYTNLIAAAPKATRTEMLGTDVDYVRPGVYVLTMRYKQFGADDALIHEGRALYFMKSVNNEFKLFAVF
jgi:hypothetical protein